MHRSNGLNVRLYLKQIAFGTRTIGRATAISRPALIQITSEQTARQIQAETLVGEDFMLMAGHSPSDNVAGVTVVGRLGYCRRAVGIGRFMIGR
jgi:hypothetical protein